MLEHADQMNVAPRELLKHFGALTHPVMPNHASGKEVAAPTARTMRLLAAGLKRLSADCDYDTWLRIGAIVFHVSGGTQEGFDCFDTWSSASTMYKAQEVRAKWKSFRLGHPRPLTMGTLRFMLTEQGHEWANLCAEVDGETFEPVEAEVQQ